MSVKKAIIIIEKWIEPMREVFKNPITDAFLDAVDVLVKEIKNNGKSRRRKS